MGEEIITFGDIEVEKHKFHHRKNLILLKDLDIKKYRYLTWFLQLKKNYKYFIGYKDDDHKNKPLRIMLQKASAYVKRYE